MGGQGGHKAENAEERAEAGRGAAAVLALAGAVAAAFFVSFWGVNAEGLGRHDMGIALALSFAMPLTLYASWVCAALALLGAVVAWKRGRPPAVWLWALVVSLLPVSFLLLVDLLGSARGL